MDNGERGRKLTALAAEYLQDMETSYGRRSWNAVVRRAQEVVELSLKGVLSYLGVDFPKVHDPATVFIATISARGMALGAAEAADVSAVSARLARKRAPAFYFEQTEDAAAAEEAAADARRIHRLCTRLVAGIEAAPSEPDPPASGSVSARARSSGSGADRRTFHAGIPRGRC